MATYTQYRNSSGGYSSPNTQVVQTALNEAVPVKDDYIAFQTGQYEYTVVIGDYSNGTFNSATVVQIDRSGSVYYVSRSQASEVTCNISNEYYVYSSIGKGQYIDYPRSGYYTSLAVMIMCVFTVLSVVLRNLFPRWRLRRET